jgi:hypothetical protein
LIWEERNSGRYEHARACRERVRAPRAREKTHQPSNDIRAGVLRFCVIIIFCTINYAYLILKLSVSLQANFVFFCQMIQGTGIRFKQVILKGFLRLDLQPVQLI